MSEITQLPNEILLENKRRLKNRIVLEVMQHLWDNIDALGEFTLADCKKCKVKQFSEPHERDGQARFGFDVTIDTGGLHHIEFLVTDSGFGGDV